MPCQRFSCACCPIHRTLMPPAIPHRGPLLMGAITAEKVRNMSGPLIRSGTDDYVGELPNGLYFDNVTLHN